MGVVYRATDLSLERPVALKLIAPELTQDERLRARFLREPRLAASLDHANVVPIYEAGECDGQLYLAMRYVDGEDLKTMLEREGRLPPERALSVLGQIAGALVAAHRRGLVHRDVKPANVMLDQDGHAYLTDFGITKLLGGASTDTGRVVGTLDYMAPEQIRGEPVDGRTDCYALGCILYECLAGTPPFRRETEAETMWAHMQERPAPLRDYPNLDPVLRKALAKQKYERHASCAELIEETRQALGVGALAGRPPAPPLKETGGASVRQDPGLDLVPPRTEVTGHGQPRDAPLEHAQKTPARDMRKTVTVVLARVTSSAMSGDLDPEALQRVLSDTVAELVTALERYGGSVDRLGADSLVAVFGIPALHEDDAIRAVRAANELRECLAARRSELESLWGMRLALHAGISTGDVVVRGGADERPRVTGEAVSVAPRLAHAAAAGEILIAENTCRLVRDTVDVEPMAPSGDQPGAIQARRLVAVRPDVPARVSHFESPMVGREREQRRLRDAFEQAVGDASCQLFTVLGAPGVGKSRLVQEFLGAVGKTPLVARGRCLPYGEGITYWPVVEAVNAVSVLDDAISPQERERHLAAMLTGGDEAELVARRLAELMGLADAVGGVDDSFWAVRKFFETLARRRPLVLVFDDIQWGEATFLDLVEHLADWVRDAPMLLVCIARPELLDARPNWGGGKWNSTSILLEPLSERECADLITNVLGRAEVPESVQSGIAETAGRNPLFVEEMLAMLIEDGVLVRDDGRWVATADLTTLRAPPTIKAVLAARLDRLADEERAVVEGATVEGRVFHESAAAELSSEAPVTVATTLATLVRKQLITPDHPVFSGERAYRFRHLLLLEAAYDSIPKERRARLHERYAGWLELTAGERASEFEEILGYHLEQAYKFLSEIGPVDVRGQELGALAAGRLAGAGRRAMTRGDMPAATKLLRRAAGLLPPRDLTRLKLLLDLGEALMETGQFPLADSSLDEVLDAASATGDAGLRAHAMVVRLLVRAHSTHQEPSSTQLMREADEAIKTLNEVEDHTGLAAAYRVLSLGLSIACNFEEATRAAERSMEHAVAAGDERRRRLASCQYAQLATYGPTHVVEAIAQCEEILEQAQNDKRTEGLVTNLLSRLYAMRGDFKRARELYTSARMTLQEMGQSVAAAATSLDSCAVEMLADDPAAAERELRRDYTALEEMGEKPLLSTVAAELARAVYEQGDLDEANHLTHTAEELAAEDDPVSQALWRAVRAKVLARKKKAEQGRALAEEAVELLQGSGELVAQADAVSDLGEVLRLSGRPDEARDMFERALSLYARKGDVISAARTRTAIDALPGNQASTRT